MVSWNWNEMQISTRLLVFLVIAPSPWMLKCKCGKCEDYSHKFCNEQTVKKDVLNCFNSNLFVIVIYDINV